MKMKIKLIINKFNLKRRPNLKKKSKNNSNIKRKITVAIKIKMRNHKEKSTFQQKKK